MADHETPIVEALLRERDSYVRTGQTDRVAQVDAELGQRGVAVEPEADPAPKRRRAPKA